MMNKIYFSFLLSLLGLANLSAQKVLPNTGNNMLTQAEFNAVEVNGVTFQDLAETNGKLSEIKQLFGLNLSYESFDDAITYKNFIYDDLGITFNSDDGSYFYPQSIDFYTPSASLKIKGKTIKIGDDISLLGPGIAINQKYGGAVFFDEDTESACFSIKIDENNLITKIEFDAY